MIREISFKRSQISSMISEIQVAISEDQIKKRAPQLSLD